MDVPTFTETCSSSSSRIGDGEEKSVISLSNSGENACDDCAVTLPRKMRCSPVLPNTMRKMFQKKKSLPNTRPFSGS